MFTAKQRTLLPFTPPILLKIWQSVCHQEPSLPEQAALLSWPAPAQQWAGRKHKICHHQSQHRPSRSRPLARFGCHCRLWQTRGACPSKHQRHRGDGPQSRYRPLRWLLLVRFGRKIPSWQTREVCLSGREKHRESGRQNRHIRSRSRLLAMKQ